ncbi:putative virion-associated RNA polymerase [Alcaligenes phage vB_Af_QDWS595]|uniref:Virion-associated RNA polymerase n=1 Tax=Alcaligenes phage vB_Af_QDWS595 TaxID=2877946 RepID=A0AAE9BZT7_9CAUD|nr:putative virion-associated RNA polymerase [Alcaligenes phage vB_Af_QDWS595]UCR75508.1 putative virion-associated RNA polymerase [Alcaligenes phage vB_Af_QDWS595]
MSSFNDLTNSLSEQKKQSVVDAASQKKSVMGSSPVSDPTMYGLAAVAGRDIGMSSASQEEQNLRTMTPAQLLDTYGANASEMIRRRAQAANEVRRDSTIQRSPTEAVTDTLLDVGMGFGSLGNLGALGLGMISPQAGASAAQAMSDATETVQSWQSDALQARRRLMEARQVQLDRDNKAQYEREKQTDGELVASLARFGRGFMNTLDNATEDSLTFTSGSSQGIGSMLAGGVLSRGATALGNAVVSPATRVGLGISADAGSTAARLASGAIEGAASIGSKAALPAAIGALEGGSAYQEVVNQIMEMSFDDLEKNSPRYRDLIASGSTPEEARLQIANSGAMQAAAIQSPLAAAAGFLVPFERSPFRVGSPAQVAQNIVREGVEETLQSSTGQIAQNIGVRNTADETQSISEGVGEQGAMGALYGVGTAAGVQGPGAIARSTIGAAITGGRVGAQALKKAGDSLDTLREKQLKKNEAASPVSADKVEAAVNAVTENSDQKIQEINQGIQGTNTTPEQKAQSEAYINDVVQMFNLEMPADALVGFEDSVASALGNTTSTTAAIQNLAGIVNDAKANPNAKAQAQAIMIDLMDQVDSLIMTSPESINALDADHPASQLVREYTDVLANISNTPEAVKARKAVTEEMENLNIEPVSDQDVQTPEGVSQSMKVVTQAQVAPGKGNPDTIENLLMQADRGLVSLNPSQRRALTASLNLLRAARNYTNALESAGIETAGDVVSREILSEGRGRGIKFKSAYEHTKDILRSLRSNDRQAAEQYLQEFSNFVDHMNNKVNALNTNYVVQDKPKKGTIFRAYNPTSQEWYTPETGVKLHSTNPGSIQFAQTVSAEAQFVSNIYNGLAEMLGLPADKVGATLDQNLQGNPEQVAEKHKPVVEEPVQQETAPVEEVVIEQTAQEPVVESVTEPTPVVEPEAVVETPQTKEEVSKPETKEPKVPAIKVAFPDLTGGDKNRFVSSFSLPNQPISRIAVNPNPIGDIRSALSTTLSMEEFIGSPLGRTVNTDITKAYSKLMDLADELNTQLDTQLDSFLDSVYNKKSGKTIREAILEGTDVQNWNRGQAINLTNTEGDGIVYEPSLSGAAALAGIQFLISGKNRTMSLDVDEIREVYGINASEADAIQSQLYDTMSLSDASDSIVAMLNKYWGVQADDNAPIRFTNGIPRAMAGEILSALETKGAITITPVQIKADMNQNRIRFNPSALIDAVESFPDAIERMVAVEPEELVFINQPPSKIKKNQMNSKFVEITEEQVQALNNEQNTPFYLNKHMAGFFSALGSEGLVELFGAGDIRDMKLNQNHRKSLEGQNLTISDAYKSMVNRIDMVQSYAEASGQDIGSIPNYYQYQMASTNRMHMQGKNNPQSSKVMREVMLPTQSTLDLSDSGSQDYRAYMLAMGQALDLKVEPTNEKVLARIEELRPSLDVINEWVQSFDENGPLNLDVLPAETIKVIKDNFNQVGAKLVPVALHALVDYARLENTTDRSSFNTSLYLEADGVTNGPMNSIAILTSGEFTPEWFSRMGKGGLTVGNQPVTIGQHRQKDSVDLYETTLGFLTNNVSNMRRSLAQSGGKDALNYTTALYRLMSTFLKDMSIQDGKLVMTRGITKNPLTITLYGSGAEGIAENIVDAMLNSLYERKSLQAQNGGSLFEDAVTNKQYADAITEVMTNALDIDPKTQDLKITSRSLDTKNTSPEEFTFGKKDYDHLVKMVKNWFIDPMRDAVTETVGQGLVENMELIQLATNAQSIVVQHQFQKALNDIAKQRGEEVSTNDLKQAYARIKNLYPVVETGAQNMFMPKMANHEISGLSDFGRTLEGRFHVEPTYKGPDAAGVRGTPMLVIGSGDGLMMQHISLMDSIKGTLKVFDGMNMPLDKIGEYSQGANESVLRTWMNNPIADLSANFDKFMANADIDLNNEALASDLARALKLKEGDSIESTLRYLQGNLQTAARWVGARQEALDQFAMSVDQMASAGSPYVHNGKVMSQGSTIEDLTYELNKLVADKMKFQSPKNAGDIISGIGRKTASGAFLVNVTTLQNQVDSMDLAPHEKTLISTILKDGSLNSYRILHGSVDELATYAKDSGHTFPTMKITSSGFFGVTNTGSKVISLVNPSNETLIHELVHASTFEKAVAHFRGDKQSKYVTQAFNNIELLMNQFVNLGDQVEYGNAETRTAFNNARSAIMGYMNNESADPVQTKAAALNEFMAWGLSNRRLADLMGRNTANPLVQFAKDILSFIKNLFWGVSSNQVPSPGKDMLSNLVFNSELIVQYQPTVAQTTTDISLFQSSIYGTNDRLSAIGERFSEMISTFISPVDLMQRDLNRLALHAARQGAIENGTRVGNTFDMTVQEANVFRLINESFALELGINPVLSTRLQEIYTEVSKKLDVSDFMVDPMGTDPGDRKQANEKYNTVMGEETLTFDSKGRSSILPTFFALAVVNDNFRQVLSNMEIGKKKGEPNRNIDQILTDLANDALDSLSKTVSGEKGSKNMQMVLDSLADTIQKSGQNAESYIERVTGSGQSFVDRANDFVAEHLERASQRVVDLGKGIESGATNELTRTLGRATQLVGMIASEKNANAVGEGVSSYINRTGAVKPLKKLINDLVGRTKSNATVLDLVKTVRSMVQKARQEFRDTTPVIIASKFSRTLEEKEWSSLYRSMGKSDIAALSATMSSTQVIDMLKDQNGVTKMIGTLEDQIKNMSPNSDQIITKGKQLAHFMNTGEYGSNLLRNARAVASLFGEKVQNQTTPSSELVQAVDQLITLYSLDTLSESDKRVLQDMVNKESDGIEFAMQYLRGQRAEEMTKAGMNEIGALNMYKGFVPTQNAQGLSLLVANSSEATKLRSMSYQRIGSYGSALGLGNGKDYYFAPVNGRAAYNQGIAQYVRNTVSGVDALTGSTTSMMVASRVTDPVQLKRIERHLTAKAAEGILPIYNAQGKLIAAELGIDPNKLAMLKPDTNLARMIGVWRGRQVEEVQAAIYNERVIESLFDMWDREKTTKGIEYVNVLDRKEWAKDPVLRDAMNLLPTEMKAMAEQKFGKDKLMVRQDMLDDAFGYRSASVGDIWTGNSRWSDATRRRVQAIMTLVFKDDAYKYAVNAENIWQNVIHDAKTMIIVKSVVVPAINLASNVLQMISRGVNPLTIAKKMATKTVEVDRYTKALTREVEIDAELRAYENNPAKVRALNAEKQTLQDSYRRLSIWPLIQAGEFNNIADASIGGDEVLLTEGKLMQYMEKLVDKLPESIKNAGRYALITKDTALFRGLQRAVDYGDFLAKAIIYDDLTERKGKTHEQAVAQVTEEFVNYDRSAGRFRGYLESTGLLWFYNYMIRSVKVAASIIRNNPVHAMIAGLVPMPDVFGGVGSPVDDNLITKMADGRIEYSIGIGQALRAPSLNPWYALTN